MKVAGFRAFDCFPCGTTSPVIRYLFDNTSQPAVKRATSAFELEQGCKLFTIQERLKKERVKHGEAVGATETDFDSRRNEEASRIATVSASHFAGSPSTPTSTVLKRCFGAAGVTSYRRGNFLFSPCSASTTSVHLPLSRSKITSARFSGISLNDRTQTCVRALVPIHQHQLAERLPKYECI